MTTTFKEKLQAKIQEAQVQSDELYAKDLESLLDNPNFIEAQRKIEAKSMELRHLNSVINQLNCIQPFVANDGSRYSVSVYPISFFGKGLGEILGIIASSRSAFTDDLMLQYSAITGIDMVELAEAEAALGRPAYCHKDGTVIEAVPGDLSKLRDNLLSITIKLGMKTIDFSQLTKDRFDLWYARAELAANKKAADYNRNLVLETQHFTMEG